jgi:hypothetical protein
MTLTLIKTEIILDAAPDDPPEYYPKYQDELAAFARSLDAAGAEQSQMSISLNSANAGGWPIGDFLIAFVPSAITGLAAVAGAWVQARYGRKVRIKIGDIEAEGRSITEIEQLLERAASFQDIAAKNAQES